MTIFFIFSNHSLFLRLISLPKSLIQKLNRFVENKDHVAKLRACFAGLWSLEDSDIVQKAIENPELFVMKPQREGGGLILNFDSTLCWKKRLEEKLT